MRPAASADTTVKMDRAELERLDRESLVLRAQAAGIKRARVLTRPELVDELVRLDPQIEPTQLKRSRGFFGLARDLLSRVVERGLHLPDAAERFRQALDDRPPQVPRPEAQAIPTVTLAEIYAAQGHNQRAIDTLKRVLEAEPDHGAARALLEKLQASDYVAPEPKLPPEPEVEPAVEPDDESEPALAAESEPALTIESDPEAIDADPALGADLDADGVAELASAFETLAEAAIEGLASVVAVTADAALDELEAAAADESLAEAAANALAANLDSPLDSAPPANNESPLDSAPPPSQLVASNAESPPSSQPVTVALPLVSRRPPQLAEDDRCVAVPMADGFFVWWRLSPAALALAEESFFFVRLVAIVSNWDAPDVRERDVAADPMKGELLVKDLPPDAIVRVAVGFMPDGEFVPVAHSPALELRSGSVAHWTVDGASVALEDPVVQAAIERASHV